MGVSLATDVGGTFTDIVLARADGGVHVVKTLTTPDDPTEGLLRGVTQALDETGIAPQDVDRFVHATTLATNVILERRGVPVAFVTTAGFRSMLALGRQARVEEERFDLAYAQAEPPVPLTHTFTVPERLSASGEILQPLDETAAGHVADQIAELGVAAVAVCLLHSYADPVHERRLQEIIAARLPAGTPVVISCEVWPELGEYERATTTLMSAYVGPVMAGYLTRLSERLAALGIRAPVQVMESAGGVLPAALAASRAVYTIESGPAAGVIAAARAGAARGLADLISFDMGGTTAKAGLVRGGRPGITFEFQVGGKGSFGGRRPGTGVPIKVPAIDLAEVGSGGGSIAWVDAGTLRVGPKSAAADPGPACYGRGGDRPTVTDANLVLGYLDPDGFGEFRLSADLARQAIEKYVAGPLGGVPVIEAALICALAISWMAAAGLLHAELSVERARTFLAPASRIRGATLAELTQVFGDLEDAARTDLSLTPSSAAESTRSLGIRFIGQAHALTIDLPAGPVTQDAVRHGVEEFYKRYRESYGIDLRDPVEVTTARVRVTQPGQSSPLKGETGTGAEGVRRVWLDGDFREVPVRDRTAFMPGEQFSGPYIVTEPQASLLVPPGWHGTVDDHGAVLLERA
jgi:N-methylhydantoinase A